MPSAKTAVLSRAAIGLALLLLTLPSVGSALCGWNDIHLFTDLETETCYHFVTPGEPFTLYVVASFDSPIETICEAFVHLPDWLEEPDPGVGTITETWTADMVTGNLATGLTLYWDTPLEPWGWGEFGMLYLLGSIEIVSYTEDWLSEPLYLEFEYGSAANDWDESYVLLPGLFTFNHESGWCENFVVDPPNEGQIILARRFEPMDGSPVQGVFDLEFEVYCDDCYGSIQQFDGSVTVDGELIHEFEGDGYGAYSLPISVAEHDPGALVSVVVEVWSWHVDRSYELTYIVDQVGVGEASFSTVKSIY